MLQNQFLPRRFLPSRFFSSPEPKLTGELIVVGRPLSSIVMYVCVYVSTGAFEDRGLTGR